MKKAVLSTILASTLGISGCYNQNVKEEDIFTKYKPNTTIAKSVQEYDPRPVEKQNKPIRTFQDLEDYHKRKAEERHNAWKKRIARLKKEEKERLGNYTLQDLLKMSGRQLAKVPKDKLKHALKQKAKGCGNIRRHKNTLTHFAKKHGIEPELAIALAGVESCYNEYKISHAGACGLVQLMPFHYKGSVGSYHDGSPLREGNCLNPNVNADIGLDFLASLDKKYTREHSLYVAVAAYNSGERKMDKGIEIAKSKGIDTKGAVGFVYLINIKKNGKYYFPEETRNYSFKVMERKNRIANIENKRNNRIAQND